MSDEAEKKAALIAEAKELGVEVDGRSSAARIQEKIDEFRAGRSEDPEEAQNDHEPDPEVNAQPDPGPIPDGDIRPEDGEVVSKREALINRLVAFGIPEEDVQHLPDDGLAKMFKQVKNARDRRAKAEREARDRKAQGEDFGQVMTVSVLPHGEGKISTGTHLRGIGDLTYEVDEVIEDLPAHTAKKLIEKGWVREASKPVE